MAGYTALIDLRVNGLDGLKKVTDSITSINNLIKQIKPVPTLFDQKNRGGTEAERASVQKAKDALSGLVKAYADGNTRVVTFSTSMAGLSNQIRSFNVVVGNAKVGSENFVNGIVAAERASRKLTNAEYDRLRVLRNIYTAEKTGGRTTTTAAQEVLERGRKILATDANGLKSSINELELYEAEIKTVFATVSQGTPVFRELQIALAAVNKELDVARGMGAIQGPALPAGFTGQGARSGGFPSSPIRGGVGMRGSPAALQARNAMMQNALIGGAFPMLFGGGAGAVLGGAAGGFIPGNPMMSIVTSALGTMVDQFVASVAEMGVAVTSTSGTFDLMREKALFSSTAVEDQAIALEEQGKVTELANLLTQDLAKSIGGEGVRALQALGDETNILTKEWNLLTAQLFALVAGPLAAFINALNTVLGGITTENRLNTLRNEATPAQQKRLAEITAEERGGVVRNVRGTGQAFIAGPESTQVRQEILKRATAEGIVPAAPPGRVTSADRRTITAPRPKADRAARDAEREAERVAELVRSQALVTAELKRQEEFSAKIFAAELAKDPMLARRLKGEQQLVEWGYETANLLEKEESAAGRLALAQAQQAKQGLIIQETAQDLAKLAADRLKAHQQTLRDLDTELQLALALTNEERNRIALEAERLNLKDQGRSDQEIEEILAKKVLLTAPGMQIKTFIAESSRQLNDLEAVAIRVSQGIGDAVGNSLANGIMGLIEGTATAKEVFAGFLRDVSQILVQEGTKMIATYIAIGIARIFAGMSGGIQGAGDAAGPKAFSGSGPTFNPKAFSMPKLAANGATFANGIAKFASGGIVSSPTLFKFADGGTTRTGLMGEAGPEAIMPLKRGADGSLGVQANGLREAMNQDRAAGGGTPVLNMSFQSTSINGVEYVSRDQLEQAMEQTRRDATRDGANRGMTQTLDKLQQSPSTRSRVGMR